jgi:hypothetical protein
VAAVIEHNGAERYSHMLVIGKRSAHFLEKGAVASIVVFRKEKEGFLASEIHFIP